MAELIHYEKRVTVEGDIVEKKAWKVNKSKNFPHSIKYSLVYIHKGNRILGYDNEKMKGDHKHYFEKEERYNFVNIDELFDDFDNEVEKLRRKLYGNQEN